MKISGGDVVREPPKPPPALVSGTSVEFSVDASAGQIPVHQWQLGDWSEVQVKEFELKILGQQVGNPAPPPPRCQRRGVRSQPTASTSASPLLTFQTILSGKIALRVVFKGRWWMEGGIEETSEKEMAVEVDIKVYNKAGLVATAVPPNSAESAKAKECINIAGGALEGMKHTVEPKPFDDAQAVNLAQLEALIKKSTVLVGVTHGSGSGIHPSDGYPTQAPPATWQQIAGWTQNPNPQTEPPYNLVVFMACATTSQDNGRTPAGAFGMRTSY